jgi:hypothetical protein
MVTLLDRLAEREELVFGNTRGIGIELDEIVYLARNVWRAKSAFSDTVDTSMEKGLTRSLAKLHFTRCTCISPPCFVRLNVDNGAICDGR